MDRGLYAGGPLGLDHVYVRRAVDDELAQALLAHEYCCVLAPRKSGKSSLRVRLQAQLGEQGVHCIHIDASLHGAHDATAEEWYLALTLECSGQLGRPRDQILARWREQSALSPLSRFVDFVRLDLASAQQPTVVFIDEIDSLIAARKHNADDFFAALRALYNERTDRAELRQLTFCLLGVATAYDLIRDPNRTPFNIGRLIYLRDFTRSELAAFEPALQMCTAISGSVLDEIHAWTQGHPYLTHKLCCELVHRGLKRQAIAPEQVPPLVEELFSRRAGRLDTVLLRAEQMFKRLLGTPRGPEAIRLYASLLRGPVSNGKAESRLVADLWLTGLIGERDAAERLLAVRNRIFATTFDVDWLLESVEGSRFSSAIATQALPRRPVHQRASTWLVLGGCLLTVAIALGSDQFLRKRQAVGGRPVQSGQVAPAAKLQILAQPAPAADSIAPASRVATPSPAPARRAVRLQADRATPKVRPVPAPSADSAPAPTTAAAEYADVAPPLPPLVEQCGQGSQLFIRPNAEARALVSTLRSLAATSSEPSSQATLLASLVTQFGSIAGSHPLARLSGPEETPGVLALIAIGPRLFAARGTGGVRIWNLSHGAEEAGWSTNGLLPGGFAVSAEGRHVVTVDEDGEATLWDGLSRRPLHHLQLKRFAVPAVADISEQKNIFLVGSDDSDVHIVDMNTGKLRARLPFRHSVLSSRFSPDGEYVAVAYDSCEFALWRLKDQQRVFLHPTGFRSCRRLDFAFTTDGTRLLVSSGLGDVVALRVSDGHELQRFPGHSRVVTDIASSLGDRYVATASKDKSVRLYDSRSGTVHAVLLGAQDTVDSVRFSPDGRWLVTLSADSVARLYSIESARLVLEQMLTEYHQATFSADGHWFIVADRRQRIRMIPVSPSAILRCACNMARSSPEYPTIRAACDIQPNDAR